MKLIKFEKIEQIKVGDSLIIDSLNGSERHEVEEINMIINEIYTTNNTFNFNMMLRGDSWAKNVHIIEED